MNASDLRAKTAAWHSTTNEVFHFITDIPGDGAESKKDNRFGEEGDTQSDPASVNNSDRDYSGDSDEVNEPRTLKGGGLWEKNVM